MSVTVDVRCPVGPRKLFTKLKLNGETPRMVQPGNLIEFSCGDCARTLRRTGQYDGKTFMCLHRYNFVGELIETELVFSDGD